MQGRITLGLASQSLWFSAYNNCDKKFDLQVGSDIRCSSCNQRSQITVRARIPIYIKDDTETITAVLYEEDVVQLVGRTGAELKDVEDQGISMLKKIGGRIKNYHIVCYVRFY
ncbi:replication factor A [Striga asiatica]|uniref:Replication factor A n=1 Tax=Striga asiatica TaxID=4170 RepID=A0A5A7QFC4_STRAF|nr:replication factor A [Striga asiatica]